MMARMSPDSPSTSATSSSARMPSAKSFLTGSVMGMGQNRPFAIFMAMQDPRQSSWPMKPSSAVYTYITSMNTSKTSRESSRILINFSASLRSSARSDSGSSRGFNDSEQ